MRVRGRIVNIAVLVTTLATCLVVGELALRIGDLVSGGAPTAPPPVPYRAVTPKGSRLIPETDVVFLFEGTSRPVRVRVNRLGFRGGELPDVPRCSGERILILGDSVTFGYGIEEDSTFVALLERLLEEDSCSKNPCVVVNGGVEDAGIREERMILEEVGDAVKPDIVLLGFYANDSRPPVGFHQEYLEEDPVDRWVRTHPSLTFRSRMASFLHHRYRTLLMALHLYQSPILARFAWVDLWREGTWRTDPSVLDSLIELARFDWGAAWVPESWETVARELEYVRRWCGVRGVRLGAFYLPVQVQIEGSKELPYPAHMLERVCNDLQIPFYDTVPVLRRCSSCFIDQCHVTHLGHRRIAAGLREWVCIEFFERKTHGESTRERARST